MDEAMADLDNPSSSDPWSLLTVILLGAALTLLLLVFVIGFLAKAGRNRRPHAGDLDRMRRPTDYNVGKINGGGAAGNGGNNMMALGEGNGGNEHQHRHHLQHLHHAGAGGSNTLVNQAFQDVGAVGMEAADKNPDVIPMFNSGEKATLGYFLLRK